MVFASSHPLVQHKIAALRDVRTEPPEFRALVRSLAVLLAYEATADLATVESETATPMGVARDRRLTDLIGVVPILRAGLGMAEGLLDLFPRAEVWHLGMFRDEATLQPMEYYNKLPPFHRLDLALVVDPMLATGGSAAHACLILKRAGVERIKLISLIAAPEGIARMTAAMPDVPIYVGVVDARLNEIGFIDPGLGDAGDRQFGTAPDRESP